MNRSSLLRRAPALAALLVLIALAPRLQAEPITTGSSGIPSSNGSLQAQSPSVTYPGLAPGQTITRYRIPPGVTPGNPYIQAPLTPTPQPLSGESNFTGFIDLLINGVQYLAPIIGKLFLDGLNNLPGHTSLDATILQLDVAGGDLPPGMMLQVSPTIPSTGQVNIAAVGGGMYHIDSFFDVFTELSIDGGATWHPADAPFHVVSVPEPTTIVLLLTGLALAPLIVRHRRSRSS